MSQAKLHVSPDLALPLDFVTQTQAILARKRVGKSYTASVQAEEMLKAKQQVLVIDYTGAWWGLRAGADGKADGGYPIHVFGGDHADVPLEEGAGEVLATAAVKERFSAIFDLSHFRKGQALRFLTPFLETLYRLNRDALHLFADECDAYAPQRTFGLDDSRTLGAMNDIVRRGGIRGIGCTLISQRPAVVNKDILTMCGVLTVLRISHPKDIAPVREWIDLHGDPARAGELVKSLPSLPIGTCWVWAGGWPTEEGILCRVRVRERETFDSGATPKPGQSVKAPKVLRPVDLAALGETIRQTAEQAKANDPRNLRAEVDRLRAALAKAEQAKPAPPAKEKRVEVPAISEADLRRIGKAMEVCGKAMDRVHAILEDGPVRKAHQTVANIEAGVQRLLASTYTPPPATAAPRLPMSGVDREMAERFGGPSALAKPAPKPTPPDRPRDPSANGQLGRGERAILTAVAQFQGATREMLTVQTGYKRSSRDTYIQRLKEKEYIDIHGDVIQPTAAGFVALGDFRPLPEGDELRKWWLDKLTGGERAVLEVVASFHPAAVDRQVISERTNYQRSSRDTYIQRLSARKLIESVGPGAVKASDNLFG